MEKITKIKNLTPHDVTIVDNDGNQIEVFKRNSDIIPRVSSKTIEEFVLGKIKFTKTTFGNVENLPDKQDDTLLIVSSIVCQACRDRDDLVIVNETVRDDNGRIVGCKSFSINPFLNKK